VLHIEPTDLINGYEIGLGIQIPDVDVTGDPKTQIAWHRNNDKNWIDPGLFNTIVIKGSENTAVEKQENKGTAAIFTLAQNYPNPFNPVTTIEYSTPKDARVKLTVYNVLGKEVATLVDQKQSAGYYNIGFNGANLTSGVYIYKLVIDNQVQMKKMTLLK